MLIEGFLTERVFMNDVLLFGGILAGVTAVIVAALAYAVYGGVHGTLASAKPGEIYNFIYKQPLQGEPERYLAKVVEVHTLDDYSIRRLNARSNYRRYDDKFVRTNHLVKCQTVDGKIRNFYAERTVNCRKPLLAGAVFKTGLAGLLF